MSHSLTLLARSIVLAGFIFPEIMIPPWWRWVMQWSGCTCSYDRWLQGLINIDKSEGKMFHVCALTRTLTKNTFQLKLLWHATIYNNYTVWYFKKMYADIWHLMVIYMSYSCNMNSLHTKTEFSENTAVTQNLTCKVTGRLDWNALSIKTVEHTAALYCWTVTRLPSFH